MRLNEVRLCYRDNHYSLPIWLLSVSLLPICWCCKAVYFYRKGGFNVLHSVFSFFTTKIKVAWLGSQNPYATGCRSINTIPWLRNHFRSLLLWKMNNSSVQTSLPQIKLELTWNIGIYLCIWKGGVSVQYCWLSLCVIHWKCVCTHLMPKQHTALLSLSRRGGNQSTSIFCQGTEHLNALEILIFFTCTVTNN